MKKKVIVAVIVILVAGLFFPVYNLLVPLAPTALAKVKTGDAVTDRAIEILENKCAICHTTTDVTLPFYAMFPIAKQLTRYDIQTGTRHVSFSREFMPDEAGMPVSEATLAKVEYV
ncbi:MAG TPA: heme-binding domain-containing protein, partial [Candidatus Hydrogenedentes bacterium]|nr:heme-binding domain-containing protein [Candidatus Hydrogenedentota bacterium]